MIGVDSSPGMLDVARARAEAAGVASLVDLRLGDLREPPVAERVPLVICPFRSLLHMETEAREAARAPRGASAARAGRAASSSTSSRRAVRTSRRRTAAGSSASRASSSAPTGTRARGRSRSPCASGDAATSFGLHWLSAAEWRRLLDEAGFDVEALYGWFDRRPYDGEEDMIFVCDARAPLESDGRVIWL